MGAREHGETEQALLAGSGSERQHARQSDAESESLRRQSAGFAPVLRDVSINLRRMSIDESRSLDGSSQPIPWSKFMPLILFRMLDAVLWTTAFPFMLVRLVHHLEHGGTDAFLQGGYDRLLRCGFR